ncbi:unnamed protein product [Lathyrus sativus]|nr:unnamed protein product [Lathyrus sativus]
MFRFFQGNNYNKSPDECRCGLDTPFMTAWTDVNPGCRFYGYGMYKFQGHKRCNNFVWYDEEMTPRAKESNSSLNQGLSLEKIKVNECKLKEDKLTMKIKFVNMQLKFTIEMSIVLLTGLVTTSVMK